MINTTLLTQLADAKMHTYQALCQALSITEEQLFVELDRLQQQGIQLSREPQQCCWLAAADVLDPPFLQQALPENPLIFIPVLDSTNQYVLEHLPELANNSVCLAEYQTLGRGRRGRKWVSPFAGQVILSFYHCFPQTQDLSGLSLIIGVAVVRALNALNFQQVQLKWPNDIWLEGKKLGGILIEIKQSPHLSCYQTVIGVGLNVHLPVDLNLDQPIAMLSQQQKVNRNLVVKMLIEQINLVLAQFAQGKLSALLDEWQRYDYFAQQEVQLLLEQKQVSGVVQGISQKGELILRTEQGERLTFAIGEVSLRRQA